MVGTWRNPWDQCALHLPWQPQSSPQMVPMGVKALTGACFSCSVIWAVLTSEYPASYILNSFWKIQCWNIFKGSSFLLFKYITTKKGKWPCNQSCQFTQR
jgi:hypothetical protein